MSDFIVFQNKTFHDEMQGGYLWAPKRNKNGHTRTYWSNMTQVKQGDIIFSSYKRKFVSVNIAKGQCYDKNIPAALDEVKMWEREGWQVDASYHLLKHPLYVDEHIEVILEHCRGMHAPYSSVGRGNQGYLYEINNILGNYLLEEVKKRNDFIDSVLTEV